MDIWESGKEFVPVDELECGLSEDEQFDHSVVVWDNARVVLENVKAWRMLGSRELFVTYDNPHYGEHEEYTTTLAEFVDSFLGMLNVASLVKSLKESGTATIVNGYATTTVSSENWITSPWTEIFHYHDVARLEDQCGSECFDLTRSEIKENLKSESEEFRAWILSNPAVGDKFHGNGFNADVLLVQRSK